ncbi:glyceraldehyde 3-phosphate dehydrogenase NAD-binding domain-containing protein [Sulfurimonas sp. HSL1-2]|uniref:type I glyceraldehyde-3-phosphate dehydrogenase n=1 Tax=Thiomicrolovo zhangzhouensis TaxID=3131933 RepID=UPI0031F9E04A
MKKINVFINGFGRIGRALMRRLLEDDRFEIVGINDIYMREQFAYLLQFDSVYGRLRYGVEQKNDRIMVADRIIPLFNEEKVESKALYDLDIDILFQCTGIHLTCRANQPFLNSGVKKIIVSAPPLDDMPMFIGSINDDQYQGERIVSAASCSANAIAPVLKLLNEYAGVEAASVSMIHSYTAEQKLLDVLVNTSELLRCRSASSNILPLSSSATVTVEKLLPQLDGRIQTHSIRVPVPAGTLYDFSMQLIQSIHAEDLNKIFEHAAHNEYKELLAVTENVLASSDIIGDLHGITIEKKRTVNVGGKFVRLMGWQDNEVGYVSQMIKLALRLMEMKN